MTPGGEPMSVYDSFAAALAEMPDVIERIRAEHVPDEAGLCRASSCGRPGQGHPCVPHPCSTRQLAEWAAILRGYPR